MCHKDVNWVPTPLHFYRPQVDGVEPEQPDNQIDQLFNEFLSVDFSVETRKRVFDRVLELVEPCGGLFNFFHYQLEHGELTRNTWLFVVDTLTYIKTGQRKINIESYWPLLHHDLEFKPTVNKSDDFYPPFESENQADLLGLWVSHDGGFYDLMWSLRILFGQKTDNTW